MPLPGETPNAIEAVVPLLASLWEIAGTAHAPVTGVTLKDVTLQNWGEADGAASRRSGWAPPNAAVIIGPYAADVTVSNVSIGAGMASGIAVRDHVAGLVLDRLTVSDIGGRGVTSVGYKPSNVSGVVLSNSSFSFVAAVYLGSSPAAAMVFGEGMQVRLMDGRSGAPQQSPSCSPAGAPQRSFRCSLRRDHLQRTRSP